MKRRWTLLMLPLLIASLTRPARAGVGSAATQPATAPVPGLTVAILDFKTDTPGSPDFGQQIAETLVAGLSGDPGFTLVDRSSLSKTLQELELSRTGLVSTDQALKVGKLVGAKLLVSGKVFTSDKQVFITAKIIGVETTIVEGVIVQGNKDADPLALALQLGERLAKRINDTGPRLVGGNAVAIDPLPALKQKLAGRQLPKMAVLIAERHLTDARPPTTVTDPAAETEVRKILLSAGVTLIDGDERDWARGGVELVLTGEAFSEQGPKIGNLTTCTDRVEVKLVRLKDNALVLSDRDSNRAVDLTENLAAKTAIQKSGRVLALRVLEHLARTIPPPR